MTKEELEKDAEEYAKGLCKTCTSNVCKFSATKTCVDVEVIKQAYLASAEPREKRIAELEKENAELKKACDETQELLDKQIEATYKLDKENAELKDYRLTTVAKQQTDMSKYALNLEHKLSWYDDQLTKAKDHIKKLLNCLKQDTNDPQTNYYVYQYMDKAEQFLKDSEVEK